MAKALTQFPLVSKLRLDKPVVKKPLKNLWRVALELIGVKDEESHRTVIEIPFAEAEKFEVLLQLLQAYVQTDDETRASPPALMARFRTAISRVVPGYDVRDVWLRCVGIDESFAKLGYAYNRVLKITVRQFDARGIEYTVRLPQSFFFKRTPSEAVKDPVPRRRSRAAQAST